jgi:glutathione S-transferase
MKLYWSPRSPFVRKVMVCAHELGLSDRIEKVYALVAMTRTNPEVMQVNPIGRIPALVTGEGIVLYDSRVICEYLDTVYGASRLFPRETPRRWDVLRRLALGDGMLETLVLWRSEHSRPAGERSAATLAAFEQKAASALEALENDAATRELDIGDIAIGCALGYLDFRYARLGWRAQAPRAAAWFETFNARPSMQQTLPYEE